MPFDHPLYVLFSSGTTGLPKAIVHGHGGILLEHVKNLGLGWDLKPGGRLLWFTTTAWMMWNALVSALLLRSSIVMLDGDPAWPDLAQQWRLAEETRPTVMGVSPAFLMACRKAGLQPGRDFDLSSIRVVPIAGSPLPPEGYDYLYEQLGPDMLLVNGSGGTDVCSAIVSGSALTPVVRGEMAGRWLGVDATAFDPDGREVTGELGELVIRQPMPSMPVGFWNDPDGERYREAYFDMYPGVWRQGDWVRFSEAGTCIVAGRSDATLNRGGVRLGTGEFYAVIEELPEVRDSLVVHLEDRDELVLFVVADLDDELRARIKATLRVRALAAPRPGHDRRGAGDPAHADRQEARGAGQAHPARRARGRGREPWRARRARGDRRVRRASLGSARDRVGAGVPRPDRRAQRRAQRGDGDARRRGARSRRRAALPTRRKPLLGVPFTVKENIDVAGTVTSLGMRGGVPAERDAPHIAHLRAAGAIPIARDEPPGPRAALAHRQRAPRRDGQPVRRLAEPGREQRRRRGRARERHVRVRGRQRLRRLAAGAGGAGRRVRPAPDAGATGAGVRRPAADEPPADGERRATRAPRRGPRAALRR